MLLSYRICLNIIGWLFLVATSLVCVVGGFGLSFRSRLSVLDVHNYGLLCGCALISTGFVFAFAALGAFRESYAKTVNGNGCVCTLVSFFAVSASVVIALVATAGLAVVLPIKIETNLKYNMFRIIYKFGFDSAYTHAMDKLQRSHSCCGVANAADWSKTPYGKIPESCCQPDKTSTCVGAKSISADLVFSSGCYAPLYKFFYANFLYIVVAAVCLVTVFMSCLAVACVLAKARLSSRNQGVVA